jgi:hypothetical protein
MLGIRHSYWMFTERRLIRCIVRRILGNLRTSIKRTSTFDPIVDRIWSSRRSRINQACEPILSSPLLSGNVLTSWLPFAIMLFYSPFRENSI